MLDLTSTIGSVLAAFGLSGAAGLNAWLPLLAGAVAARAGWVDLGEPFDDLSSTTGIGVLAALTVADFVGDKIPAVDHVLHVLGTVVAPASGAALFAGQTGETTDIPSLVAVVLGGGVAGVLHALRAAVRPVSTGTTAGVGNPVLSFLEDVLSFALVVLAFLLPLLAAVAVVGVVVVGVRGVLRARRRLARRPRPG